MPVGDSICGLCRFLQTHINSDCTTALRHRLFFFFAVEFSSFLSISGAKGGVHGDYLHSLLNKSWLGCDFFFLIASSVLTHF